jgi:hypothetical protein
LWAKISHVAVGNFLGNPTGSGYLPDEPRCASDDNMMIHYEEPPVDESAASFIFKKKSMKNQKM